MDEDDPAAAAAVADSANGDAELQSRSSRQQNVGSSERGGGDEATSAELSAQPDSQHVDGDLHDSPAKASTTRPRPSSSHASSSTATTTPHQRQHQQLQEPRHVSRPPMLHHRQVSRLRSTSAQVPLPRSVSGTSSFALPSSPGSSIGRRPSSHAMSDQASVRLPSEIDAEPAGALPGQASTSTDLRGHHRDWAADELTSSLDGSERPQDEGLDPQAHAADEKTLADLTFRWSTLRRVSSARLAFPSAAASTTPQKQAQQRSLGAPTAIAINGLIAIGTSLGFVLLYDLGQNARGVLGTPDTGREAGHVSAVAISQDHSHVAVGHAKGHVHLYALPPHVLSGRKAGGGGSSNGGAASEYIAPSRSVAPVPALALIRSGRREGHLLGARVTSLAFVGARHSQIISADDQGLAFAHQLGTVLLLASTDVIRILGRYPDAMPPSPPLQVGASKASAVIDLAPLPLGPCAHKSDAFALAAVLTPTKLVLVGLKPKPRTWWRFAMHTPNAGAESKSEEVAPMVAAEAGTGALAWFPCASSASSSVVNGEAANGEFETHTGEINEPRLAFAWGRALRVVTVSASQHIGNGGSGEKAAQGPPLSFEHSEVHRMQEPVRAVQWLTSQVLMCLLDTSIEVVDIRGWQRLGSEAIGIRSVVDPDPVIALANATNHSLTPRLSPTHASSFKMYKRKLFLLTVADVRAGALLSWADRILALMQSGAILEAIALTTRYLRGHRDSSTVDLPRDDEERATIVRPKLREILLAALDFVFSEERLRDGSHSDAAAIQRVFEGLVDVAVHACIALEDIDFLFDELYERYELNGIEPIFLARLEPFVLAGAVYDLPPSVSQRLIAIHERRREYAAAEHLICRVAPENLDVNQVVSLGKRERLYDALVYVYTRTLHDFVSPLAELLVLVRTVTLQRRARPSHVSAGVGETIDHESLVPLANKTFGFLGQALSGLSYPSRERLPEDEAIVGRNALYSSLFSRSVIVPPGARSALRTTAFDEGDEPSYPYLRLLLAFDSEAMLDALDLAFEDSYLDDDVPGKPLNRQLVMNVLVEVSRAKDGSLSSLDKTFLNIFVARNLPKYPQFIELQPSVLHAVLSDLAQDADQSTVEDRQLATEFLLSCYSPRDSAHMLELFERAGFFRILRSIYRGERRWAALVSTYVRDPAIGADIFDALRETMEACSTSATAQQRREIVKEILSAAPTLLEASEDGMQQMADLVDEYLPDCHGEVIERLAMTPWRQFAYLRYLLEPTTLASSADVETRRLAPSRHLDEQHRLRYLELTCQHEPYHVTRYIKADQQLLSASGKLLEVLTRHEIFDALVWVEYAQGKLGRAIDAMDSALQSRSDFLVSELLDDSTVRDDDGSPSVDTLVQQISAVARVAVDVCIEQSLRGKTGGDLEGLWFHVIASLVASVRSVNAVCAPLQPDDASERASLLSSSRRRLSSASSIVVTDEKDGDAVAAAATRASAVLSGVIPHAIASLVSNTSIREVSFPRLMRRLIEANEGNESGSGATRGRSYAEFRTIVTSMLDSYSVERDLLATSARLVSSDLFEFVDSLERSRRRGWRATSDRCAECLEPVWGPASGVAAGGAGMSLASPLSRSASASQIVDSLGLGGTRPRLQKRPSMKGKEPAWPSLSADVATLPSRGDRFEEAGEGAADEAVAIALHPRWDGTSATLVRRALALPIVLLAWRAPLEFRLAPEQSVPLNFPYGVIPTYAILRALEFALVRDTSIYAYRSARERDKGVSGKTVREAEARQGLLSSLVWAMSLSIALQGVGWSWGRPERATPPPLPQKASAFYLRGILGAIAYHVATLGSIATVVTPHHVRADWLLTTVLSHVLPPHLLVSIEANMLADILAYSAALISLGLACLAAMAEMSLWTSVVARCTHELARALLPREWAPSHPFDVRDYPPAFDHAFWPRSVTAFWATQWHAFFRHQFVSLGFRPCVKFVKAVGGSKSLASVIGVLGVFAVSAWLHERAFETATSIEPYASTEYDWLTRHGATIFFLAQAVAIILERLFERTTGKKVGGPLARVWSWLILGGFGNLVYLSWCGRGLLDNLAQVHEWQWQRYVFPPLNLAPRGIYTA